MKVQVRRVGQGKYSKWCSFSAYDENTHLSFTGLANFDESELDLKENSIQDLDLVFSIRRDNSIRMTLHKLTK